MSLSTGQLETLQNLAGKKAGSDVGWVKIAAARELTDLGLATRNRSGWEITTNGEVALGREGRVGRANAADAILPLRARDISPATLPPTMA